MSNKTIIEIRAEIYKEIMEKLRQPIVVNVSDGDAERLRKYIIESYSFKNSGFVKKMVEIEPKPRLTSAQLDLFYHDYLQLSTAERFGQYIFNRTGFEFENSYNIKNAEEAYKLLFEQTCK